MTTSSTNASQKRIGQHVWTWFDTGALGSQVLQGQVIKAGPKTYTVEWVSGARNRVAQDDRSVNHLDPAYL
jgi:hypothetical protein